MFNLIQQLKQFGEQSFLKLNNKAQNPLLSNNDIIDLLLRVQRKKKSPQHKHDIAFRKIGDVRSIFRGHGMDYEESRYYQAGDDPRYMNWQLSARTGKHYMKVFREERQPGVFIVIDRRQTMRFGTQQRLKITQAARAAAIAAFSAQENNFSVGGVILDDKLEWFKENQNRQAVFDFIHESARPAMPVFDHKELQEPTIEDVLRMLNQVLTTGSTIYLISDFHDLEVTSQPLLLQLSSSHLIHAIQIIDPAEITIPESGTLTLKSVRSNQEASIDTRSLLEQQNYKSAAEEYFNLKKDLFKKLAISYQQILTTDNAIEQKIVFK